MTLPSLAGTALAVTSAERFARENAAVIGVVICVVLAYLVVRLAVRAVTRFVLLSLLAVAALVVVVQRDEIQDCATTCSCQIAGERIDVGLCANDLRDLGN